ncbi:uncharacterized protein [Hemitrygon akajei]|uniref:uncharacterized protein n=1 Tax=Hemitrygon akajei TaxID=2704970 RepID=UPI003BF9E023
MRKGCGAFRACARWTKGSETRRQVGARIRADYYRIYPRPFRSDEVTFYETLTVVCQLLGVIHRGEIIAAGHQQVGALFTAELSLRRDTTRLQELRGLLVRCTSELLVSSHGTILDLDQLKSSLDSLTKKKSDFQEKEQQQKEKISGVREQSHSLQTHITSQFAELRQIITEKEQSLLRDLREEEKRILNPMEKNLLAFQENIRFIQEEITKLKEQMDQKDSVIFLKEEDCRNRRINDDVQELAVTDETLPVEKFDHLYLLKTVLRETLDAINRGKTYKD